MKYLIIGGVSFIGSNLVEFYLNKSEENEVYCLDNLSTSSNLYSIDEFYSNSRFHFIFLDVFNEEQLFELFKKEQFEYIISCIKPKVDKDIEKDYHSLKFVECYNNILRACLKDESLVSFHMISTALLYINDYMPLNPHFNECEAGIYPFDFYTSTIKLAEDLLLSYSNIASFKITISRNFNLYGKKDNISKLIPDIITKILENKKTEVYDFIFALPYTYIDDFIKQIDFILHSDIKGTINLIEGEAITDREIIDTILEVSKKLNIKYNKKIECIENRMRRNYLCLDNSKLMSVMKNSHFSFYITPFKEGIKKTIEFYQNNPKWIKGSKLKDEDYGKDDV